MFNLEKSKINDKRFNFGKYELRAETEHYFINNKPDEFRGRVVCIYEDQTVWKTYGTGIYRLNIDDAMIDANSLLDYIVSINSR